MSEREGMLRLLNVWGYDASLPEAECGEVSRARLRCSRGSASLKEMVKQQLPWLVKLPFVNNDLYAVVIRVGEQDLDLLINDKTWTVKQSWFEKHWNGAFITFWKPAPDGKSTVNRKSPAETIIWLDSRLNNRLMLPDKASSQWTPLLNEKISLFQKKNNLEVDGIVGKTTLTRLWQSSGEAPRLIIEMSPAQGGD